MFNLEKVSTGKLVLLNILHWVLYISLCVVAPCITILLKYEMVGERSVKLTMFGLCTIIIFIFVGLKIIRKLIDKIPLNGFLWQARIRCILSLMISIITPILILFVCYLIKDNVVKALSCIETCVWFVMAGMVEDNILGMSVDREFQATNGAAIDKEKAKRASKVK